MQQLEKLSPEERRERGMRALEGIARVDMWLLANPAFKDPLAEGWLQKSGTRLDKSTSVVMSPRDTVSFTHNGAPITATRRNDERLSFARGLSRRRGHSTWKVERKIEIATPDNEREVHLTASYRKSGPDNKTTVTDGSFVVVDNTGRYDDPREALTKLPDVLI